MVDSYLSVPDWNAKALLRGVGKWVLQKHEHLEPIYRKTLVGMCSRANLVVCSMPEQKALMQNWSPNVHDILDFHDELNQVGKHLVDRPDDKVDIFWEGVALSFHHFSAVSEVLALLSKEYPLRLHLVTDLTYRPINFPMPPWNTRKAIDKVLPGIECYLSEWNPVSVRAIAGLCGLAMIPLRLDDPLYSAKPENKLLIMWRLGLPTIVSATPAYSRTMAAYGGPYWACDSQESWYTALRQALESEALRRQASECGQIYAERDFGTDALLSRWVTALSTLF